MRSPAGRVGAVLVLAAVVAGGGVVRAQPDEELPETPPEGGATPGEPTGDGAAPGHDPDGAELPDYDRDALVCDGGWRYPLDETRQEIGPARFARQLEIQKDISLTAAAFAYCETQARSEFSGAHAGSAGPCYGMLRLAGNVDLIASNLFRLEEKKSCECLTQHHESNSECEGLREQLPTLRRYDQMIVDRAELVLAYQVCASPERATNAGLRGACDRLDAAVAAEYGAGSGGARPPKGMFALSAPLPARVAAQVGVIKAITDGRFDAVVPENFIGVRKDICHIQLDPGMQNTCEIRVLDQPDDAGEPEPGAAAAEVWGAKRKEVMWGMCNELALADVNANTCRMADVYIDERGQVHLNDPLTTRAARRDATLCVDVSDFDQDHPLMITLGLDPTGSVPERLWPGETMRIGEIINRPVTREDILKLHVLGKPRGISLSEVLRINQVPGFTRETAQLRNTRASNDEACRIARSWVPVVDHEIPIGSPRRQAVIPIDFSRGRDGETGNVEKGDYVVMWVRDIQPGGSILVEYAKGQSVGHQPPPIAGLPADYEAEARRTGRDLAPGDGLMPPEFALRRQTAGVDLPVVARRARYPGSRVLRLGVPEGNTQYPLKVCTSLDEPAVREAEDQESADGDTTARCGPASTLILNEKLFVHGEVYFSARLHIGYSFFPIPELALRRTPAAQAAGEDVFEVVEKSGGSATTEAAILLAVHPFGRDARRFSYGSLDSWLGGLALVAGFTIVDRPWDDLFAGGSISVANGVSITALAHFSRRNVPVGLDEGQLVTVPDATDLPGINRVADTKGALAVGFNLGVSFDYDLFERAFVGLYNRITGTKKDFFHGGTLPD